MIPIPPADTRVAEIADIIQSVLAPVFLLAGIAGFLNVLTGRQSRIVDRARDLEPKLLQSRGSEHDRYIAELRTLDTRMKLVGRAVWMAVLAALLVCCIVVLLFAGSVVSGHFGRALAVLFILCMVFLALAFAVFLFETRIAARSMRVRTALLDHQAEDPPA
ncbi:DUF2721 domain-containing protein [Sphingomonas sabuli]|uniref:DUF2721 domain-containing protein n=1 Tax=Sphingomonas sabuli TaxID=2764186 RepID=A0A7G9L0Q4_9SPHN|nr:DUF2721 domain-containing protein [Sphingomonas sabuli]QNM82203.1 DUF2721 domain-containing protein [Sphingomonas sabuli]